MQQSLVRADCEHNNSGPSCGRSVAGQRSGCCPVLSVSCARGAFLCFRTPTRRQLALPPGSLRVPWPARLSCSQAHVPLNEMFGYSTGLRSMTQVGAGTGVQAAALCSGVKLRN